MVKQLKSKTLSRIKTNVVFNLILMLLSAHVVNSCNNESDTVVWSDKDIFMVQKNNDLAVNLNLENKMLERFVIFTTTDTLAIELTEKGKMVQLFNYTIEPAETQRITLYPNGTVKSKILEDRNKDNRNTVEHWFYKSGYLEAFYTRKNGKKFGTGLTYHDSSNSIHEIIHYNNEGLIYRKNTYDKSGNLIKSEPHHQ